MTTTFGAELRQLRRQAKLTRQELAERTGLSVDTIRGFEANQLAKPRLKTAESVAEALELTPDTRARLLTVASGQPSRQQLLPTRADSPPDVVTEAANRLAGVVTIRLKIDDELSEVRGAWPMQVRWSAAPAELTAPWGVVGSIDPAGKFPQVYDFYQRIPSRRLIVLGRPGSGKTVLAKELASKLQDVRYNRGQVPVIFGLGTWNPAIMSLREWLISELVRDYAGLAAPEASWPPLAAALIDTNRVLPILDGFDQIPASLRRAALHGLDGEFQPMVLTSRIDEYAAAVADDGPLTNAAVVELVDLDEEDVAEYLPLSTPRGVDWEALWEPLLNRMEDQPLSPAVMNLAEVFRTPLMVALARAGYREDSGRDAVDLLNARRFPDTVAIEDHLLNSFAPSVYRQAAPRRVQQWTPDRVQRWLGYLAGQLNRLDTRDLAWWQLGATMLRSARMAILAVVVGLIFGAAGGLVDWFGKGLVGAVLFGAGGLIFGLTLAAGRTTIEPSRLRIRRPPPVSWRTSISSAVAGIVIGLLVGLPAGPGSGQVASVVALAITMLVVVLVIGLETSVDKTIAPDAIDPLRISRRTALVQLLVVGLAIGVAVGVVAGPMLGLALGLACGLGFAVTRTTWGHWLFTRIRLALLGRLPWAIMAFLEDAAARGVLRRTGAVYRFRHARLQDHLAGARPTRDGTALSTVTVTIYLSQDNGHDDVEAAVEEFLATAGTHVERREEPIHGSWFRRMRARIGGAARSPAGQEALRVAAHAAETRLVHAQDATVTAELMSNLGPVIASLAPIKEAVIRTGALLIVKIDDKLAVHQLTATQQLRLDHQPALAASPRDILGALEVRSAAQLAPDRMPTLSFPGEYEDDRGVEALVWRIGPTDRDNGFDIRTTVRGIPIWGMDFDGLGPESTDAGQLTVDAEGELNRCLLRGDLPCAVDTDGERRQGVLRFAVDLRTPNSARLSGSVIVDGESWSITGESFEDALADIDDLPERVRLRCCLTCRYSDYSPAGHGLLGIACHRGAKDEYLAVRTKHDYWSVPITEQVPETYLCSEYQRRVPGTGYRQ